MDQGHKSIASLKKDMFQNSCRKILSLLIIVFNHSFSRNMKVELHLGGMLAHWSQLNSIYKIGKAVL